MRSSIFMALAFSLSLLSGCIVVHDHNNPPPPPPPPPATEPMVSLGPQAYPGYHVQANASTSLPAGAIGYLVTANGQGGYRVTWTDTEGSAAQFSGTITVDGTIDPSQTQGFSGNENLQFNGSNQLIFSSVPGAGVDGVDLVSSTDPIYLEADIEGSPQGVDIYFTGASSGAVNISAVDPVAFTSP